MAQKIATVKILGKRPLLIHCFTNETISLERKVKAGVAGNDPDEWKTTYLATKEGQLYVEPSYIFSCLRAAAVFTKNGRGSIQSKVSSTLQILDDKILFNRHLPMNINDLYKSTSEDDVYLDVRSVKNPNTKGRNIRYRVAMATGWETEFTIQWDNTIVSSSQIKQVLEDAGSLVGLADGRSIGFGRFQLISFEEKAVVQHA
ncbi:MAG: hypothetical protein H9W82_18530 [Lactobacillus sp.]|nr:hypothetical protein [Lactobacillus sp.]